SIEKAAWFNSIGTNKPNVLSIPACWKSAGRRNQGSSPVAFDTHDGSTPPAAAPKVPSAVRVNSARAESGNGLACPLATILLSAPLDRSLPSWLAPFPLVIVVLPCGPASTFSNPAKFRG